MQDSFKDGFMALVDALELGPEIIGPLVEVKQGEKVLRLLPPELRKFWAVLDKLTKDYMQECEVANRLEANGQLLVGESDYVAFKIQHDQAHRRVIAMSELLRQKVAEVCPGKVATEDLRLRVAWQVVKAPAKKRQTS